MEDKMPYTVLATRETPMLIIYLLDISASMNQPLGGRRRIDVVVDALQAAIDEMVFRSTKGKIISPRYRIAVLAYSERLFTGLEGVIQTVDKVAKVKLGQLSTGGTTETAKAFAWAEKLLADELPKLGDCPAPLVCHMTDGEYSGTDPEPIVRRIRAMSVPDGNVLVE